VSPSSPQIAGTQVLFVATASGGSGTYEYQFSQNVGGVLTVVRSYNSSPGWLWNTTGLVSATYNYQVDARSVGSVNASEASAVASFVIGTPPPTASVTLIPPQPAGPQFVGTSVTWTAFASGGTGNYEYRFWTLNSDNGAVTMVKDYTDPGGNSYAMNTTNLPPGAIHYVAVWARSATSSAAFEATDGWDGPYELKANIPPVTVVTLNSPTPASPQTSQPYVPVTWTASATDGTAPQEYRFWTYNPVTGVVTMVKDYKTTLPEDSYTWPTSGLATGTYYVAVWARSAGSAASSEATSVWVPYILE